MNNNINEIEIKRKKYCLIFYILLMLIPITTIISIILLLLGVLKIEKDVVSIVLLILFNPITLFTLTITILVNYYRKVNYKYNKSLQELINNTMITTTLTDQQNQIGYDYNKGIPREILESTRVIYLGNNYQSSNLIYGLHKNVQFNSSRVIIKNIINDKEEINFNGVYFIFKFNKSLFTNIRITQNNFDKVFWHVSYNNLFHPNNNKFANDFTIYVEKIDYANHTLKDELIDDLYKLTKKLNKQTKSKVQYVISNGYIYIAINNPTLFDYKITDKITDNIVDKYKDNYLKIVEAAIDTLKL